MVYIMTRSKYKDNAGERIDFKEAYFDKALRKTFRTDEEKYNFMKANNIVNTGDSDAKYKRQLREHEEMKREEKKK